MRQLFLLFPLLFMLAAPKSTAAHLDVLTQMLALVDSSELGREGSYVSYVDYEGIFAAGGVNPQTAAEFDRVQESDDWESWLASSLRIMGGMAAWAMYLNVGYGTSVETNGFEWFAVDQSLTFSVPPAVGNIFAGDFDAEQIEAALIPRSYETIGIDDVPTLCPTEGCDYGPVFAPSEIDQGFLFGGELGQRHPIALLPGLILHSRDEGTLRNMIDVHNGGDSLMTTMPYQLLVESLYYVEGEVLQANFFDAQDMAEVSIPQDEDISPSSLVETLPPYELVALVDAQSDSHQIARVMMVYEDGDAASQAAQIVWRRLGIGRLDDIYEEAGAQISEPYAFSSDEGSVVIVEINYPLLTDSEVRGDQRTSWGRIYRVWMDAIIRREFLPIAINTI
jgi:hypothetical protein